MNDSPVKNEPLDEDDLFYFESDHLALKGNAEYSELLKTVFILEAQRKRAIDDYSKVVELQKELGRDPLAMVEKLKNGVALGVPDLQHIVEVPKINWSKFNVSIPEECIKALNTDRVDRLKADDLKSRNSKTTHSQPWTVEEQKRLEELLVIYPPEEVELRRFRKIATALGTRTFRQVASRVQKYFLKLKKAGMPIPGRIPRIIDRKRAHRHQRLNHFMQKPSTFFPELDVPVYMNEGEDAPGPSQTSKSSDATYSSQSSNYLMTNNYHDDRNAADKNESELKLEILKRVRDEKLKSNDTLFPEFRHVGFKCDYCNEEPISGSRWHCTSCKSTSIDFCTDCVLSQLYSGNHHPLTHKFAIIRNDKTTVTTSTDSSSESVSGSVFDSNQNLETSDFDSDDYFESTDWKEAVLTPIAEESPRGHPSPPVKVKSESNYLHETDHPFEVDPEEFVQEFEVKAEEAVVFSETQNVSYSYLHSSLFVDDS